MESMRRLLFWLLQGSKGGPTRISLLQLLSKKPMNMRQLSLAAGLDYKTVEHHITLLLKNSIVESAGGGYGKVYFVSGLALAEKEFEGAILGRAQGRKKG